jgi:orotate phosphoribosyltransferase
MSEAESRLLQLLKDRSLTRGQFRLASGDTSTYYIDGRTTAVYSEGAYLIGEVLYEHTQDLLLDAIGGLAAGAIPLTTAAVISYHLHGWKIDGFWVRDQVKGHGTQKVIEVMLTPGARVVVVDDVITRGSSVLKAVEEVRRIGCEVVRVVTLVDRGAGAAALFEEKGIQDYRPIFTIGDLGVES